MTLRHAAKLKNVTGTSLRYCYLGCFFAVVGLFVFVFSHVSSASYTNHVLIKFNTTTNTVVVNHDPTFSLHLERGEILVKYELVREEVSLIFPIAIITRFRILSIDVPQECLRPIDITRIVSRIESWHSVDVLKAPGLATAVLGNDVLDWSPAILSGSSIRPHAGGVWKSLGFASMVFGVGAALCFGLKCRLVLLRHKSKMCIHCGYLLFDLNKCPECGRSADESL